MWPWLIGGAALVYVLAQQRGVSFGQELSSVTGDLTGSLSSLGGTGTGGVGYSKIGPNSDPSRWYNGTKPGTVTVAGQQQNTADWGDPTALAREVSTIAGTGAGAALGISSAVGSSLVGTTAGLALTGIGAAAAVVGVVLGIISKHHQQALAAEGKALNDADARMVQQYVMAMQGVINGAYTSIQQVQQAVQQIVQDWYGEVRPVQRGTWHYSGQDLSADYQKVWIKRTQPPTGAPGYADYHAPDPCNGACVVGHLFTERNSFLVLAAASDALAGNHGVLILPQIPSHETQTGMPEVRVVY